jgi:hypothetical protein
VLLAAGNGGLLDALTIEQTIEMADLCRHRQIDMIRLAGVAWSLRRKL